MSGWRKKTKGKDFAKGWVFQGGSLIKIGPQITCGFLCGEGADLYFCNTLDDKIKNPGVICGEISLKDL